MENLPENLINIFFCDAAMRIDSQTITQDRLTCLRHNSNSLAGISSKYFIGTPTIVSRVQ